MRRTRGGTACKGVGEREERAAESGRGLSGLPMETHLREVKLEKAKGTASRRLHTGAITAALGSQAVLS
ncbi:Myotubularin-Related Protein 3 [Manis pentadactyla]|nr:Myotubularin-Related Protein 3 [Manis pentadactyla]